MSVNLDYGTLGGLIEGGGAEERSEGDKVQGQRGAHCAKYKAKSCADAQRHSRNKDKGRCGITGPM